MEADGSLSTQFRKSKIDGESMIDLKLKYPNILLRMSNGYANYEIPLTDNIHFWGVVEQLNSQTINYSIGDVVLFEKLPNTPKFFYNNVEYFIVDEHNIFSTIDNILNKIFDYTFDYTFE